MGSTNTTFAKASRRKKKRTFCHLFRVLRIKLEVSLLFNMKMKLILLVAVFGCLYVDAMPRKAAPGGSRVKRYMEDKLQKLIDLNEKSLAELKKVDNQIHMINMKNTNIVATIRLTGGNSTFGRVEINMNGRWGSLCDDGMTYSPGSYDPEANGAAKVICRTLGFSGGLGNSVYYEPFTSLQIPSSWLPFHIDNNLECKGTERSIFDCRRRGSGGCKHLGLEDFAVSCTP